MDHIAQAVDPFVFRLSIFVLAVFVGYFVVWSVTPALHTPLLAVGVPMISSGSAPTTITEEIALVTDIMRNSQRGSALHDPGPGPHLRCGRHPPTACHGHPGQAYCTGLTLAEWLQNFEDQAV
jgi:hypothetical protein